MLFNIREGAKATMNTWATLDLAEKRYSSQLVLPGTCHTVARVASFNEGLAEANFRKCIEQPIKFPMCASYLGGPSNMHSNLIQHNS